ncbi:MAG TPA: hypothetical protein VGY53_07455 [Isosphaeraceae bacterium]|nr:hypothetical protein [Isosphaeraceae bacterium]
MATSSSAAVAKVPLWPWLLLALALGWVALVRVPIVINAQTHLDSDLAVDGLATADVARGQWRWHFPATPHIGIASALCAAPQMRIWGATPEALASGGVVAYSLLVVATLLAAWEAFGLRAACWSLVPLAFTSNGAVWLSGRLNGGHLLAAAWHAGALGLFHASVARGGWKRAGILGLWCGLGLWHDTMFLVTVATLVPIGALAAWRSGWRAGGWVCAMAAAVGFLLGDAPRELGNRLDPHNAYQDQNALVFDPELVLEHTRILGALCLPRLLAGHLLPDLSTEPPPAALGARSAGQSVVVWAEPVAWANTLLALALFGAALIALVRDGNRPASQDIARSSTRWALLLSSALVAAAFVVNKNIFNSDNYRYIIYLFVTWAIGLALALDWLAGRGWKGALMPTALAFALAALQTLDTAAWYRRLGWVDAEFQPVRVPLRDPLLDWLTEHQEVGSIYGDYWDVYRIMFLTGGRVRGVPTPFWPNRYPEWLRALPGGRPEVLVVRPTDQGRHMQQKARGEGARALLSTPGLAIYDWPVRP